MSDEERDFIDDLPRALLLPEKSTYNDDRGVNDEQTQ